MISFRFERLSRIVSFTIVLILFCVILYTFLNTISFMFVTWHNMHRHWIEYTITVATGRALFWRHVSVVPEYCLNELVPRYIVKCKWEWLILRLLLLIHYRTWAGLSYYCRFKFHLTVKATLHADLWIGLDMIPPPKPRYRWRYWTLFIKLNQHYD